MSNIVMDLAQTSRCCAYYRGRRLEAFGLNVQQARLLMEVCATPGVSQNMLFRRLCIEKSVVARTMASLEEAGYVERLTCQKDKRVIRLHPTPKALELQPKLQELWATCEQYLIEDMTEDEVAALERLLEQMKLRAAKWMEADK